MLSSANIKIVMAFLIRLYLYIKIVPCRTPVTRSIKMTISLTIMYICWYSMMHIKGIT